MCIYRYIQILANFSSISIVFFYEMCFCFAFPTECHYYTIQDKYTKNSTRIVPTYIKKHYYTYKICYANDKLRIVRIVPLNFDIIQKLRMTLRISFM